MAINRPFWSILALVLLACTPGHIVSARKLKDLPTTGNAQIDELVSAGEKAVLALANDILDSGLVPDLQAALHSVVSVLKDVAPEAALHAGQIVYNCSTARLLDLLVERTANGVSIPDMDASLQLGILGNVQLSLSNIHITHVNVASDLASLSFSDGALHLNIQLLDVRSQFFWSWRKAGMQGSGMGVLNLQGGTITYSFRVGAQADGKIRFKVDRSEVSFRTVDLQVAAGSADWLYQAIINAFSSRIQTAIVKGIENTLRDDVSNLVNNVIDAAGVTNVPFGTAIKRVLNGLMSLLAKGLEALRHTLTPEQQALADKGLKIVQGGIDSIPSSSPPPSGAIFTSPPLSDYGSASPPLSDYSPASPPTSPELPFSLQLLTDNWPAILHYFKETGMCIWGGMQHDHLLVFDLKEKVLPMLHLEELLQGVLQSLPGLQPGQSYGAAIEVLSLPHISINIKEATVSVQGSFRSALYVADLSGSSVRELVSLHADFNIDAAMNQLDLSFLKSITINHQVEQVAQDIGQVAVDLWNNKLADLLKNKALPFLRDLVLRIPGVNGLPLITEVAAVTGQFWADLAAQIQINTSG